MIEEFWKSINGFDGLYEVSNIGQVRSVDRTITTKNGQCRSYSGKILGQAIDDHGYKHVCLWKGNRQTGFVVHRLVAAAFVREIRPGEEVNHDDFNKKNNTPHNLEVTTRSDNADHAIKGGRMAKKLNEKDVLEIRFSELWGENQSDLARRFGVTSQAVNAIISGKCWKHINPSEWMASHD